MAIIAMTLIALVRSLFSPGKEESAIASEASAVAQSITGSAAVTGNAGDYTYDGDCSPMDLARHVITLVYMALLIPRREQRSPIASFNLPVDNTEARSREAFATVRTSKYIQIWLNKVVTFVYMNVTAGKFSTLDCWACDSEREARDDQGLAAERTVATQVITIGNGKLGLAWEPVCHVCSAHAAAFKNVASRTMVPLSGFAVEKLIAHRESNGDFNTPEGVTELSLPLSDMATTRNLRYVTKADFASEKLSLATYTCK